MTAQTYIYGKGQHFQYGIERISPSLLPFQQELVELSSYRGHTDQDKSIRYGFLRSGSPYLSFAFTLPHGNKTDGRSQIRVFTLVFDRYDGCPLSADLLRVLPSLTLEDLETLVVDDTIELGSLLNQGQQAPPLPSPSPDLTRALLSILFFKTEKGGQPTLLALVSPEKLLAAIAALPDWLWPHLTFNTDVRQISEPLALLNTWTPTAKQAAERANYSGASMDQLWFHFPAEEGVLLHIGGLEQEAERFLALSEEQQQQMFLDCNEDLPNLVSRLHSKSKPPKKAGPSQGKRIAHHKRSLPRLLKSKDFCQALLLFAAGLLILPLVSQHIPSASQFFRLVIPADTVLFLGAVLLGWALLYAAGYLARPTTSDYLDKIYRQGDPRYCQQTYRLCQLFVGGACLLIVVLFYLAGAGQVTVSSTALGLTLRLHLGGTSTDLLLGNLIGVLLCSIQAMGALGRACRSKFHHP